MANKIKNDPLRMPEVVGAGTAVTAERNLTAVMAVPDLGKAVISPVSNVSIGSAPAAGFQKTATPVPLTMGEEYAIRAWLENIEETDDAVIAHVLNVCNTNAHERTAVLRLAGAAERHNASCDDRRRCTQCVNLTHGGRCLAARRGELNASREYEPVRDLLHRCEGYMPGADDMDRRPGWERWPGLVGLR